MTETQATPASSAARAVSASSWRRADGSTESKRMRWTPTRTGTPLGWLPTHLAPSSTLEVKRSAHDPVREHQQDDVDGGHRDGEREGQPVPTPVQGEHGAHHRQ